MSEQEASANRFVPLSVLVEAIMAQDKEGFLEKHPESLLVLDNPGDDAESAAFQTVDVGKKSSSGDGRREQLVKKLSGAGSCVYVLKREPNQFASMVTVGIAYVLAVHASRRMPNRWPPGRTGYPDSDGLIRAKQIREC